MICVVCDTLLPDDTARCPRCRQNPFLDGRYRLESQIGRGANGTVYSASDIMTNEKLAIKELPYRHDLPPKQLELLEREAEILKQLSHPAIPRFVGKTITGEGKARALYLIQEFVDGTSLADTMDTHRYTEDEVRSIIAEVSEILAYLHSLSPPVIHRDIKPSNLMRRPDGTLALIDFGSVRDALTDPDLGGSTVAGTFGFMAPEQFLGEASAATDYYGLGATAIALLSRKDPVKLQDRTGEIRWERAIEPSPEMAHLLRRLLNADPEQRLSSTAQLQRTLNTPLPASDATPAHYAERTSQEDADRARLRELTEADQPLATRKTSGITLRRTSYMPLVAIIVLVAVATTFFFRVPEPPDPADLLRPPPSQAETIAPPAASIPHIVRLDASSLEHLPGEQVPYSELQWVSRVTPEMPRDLPKDSGDTMTCKMAVGINPDGTTTVHGVTDSPDCSVTAYQSAETAISQWTFSPPAKQVFTIIRITYKHT